MRKLLILLVAVGALASQASAASACTQWDTTWVQLRQSNGYIVGLPTQPAGATVNGRTTLQQYGWNWQRYVGGGYVSGWTYQNRFTATIWWDSGGAGNYDGRIDATGHISGSTTDRYHPSSTASFSSIGNARCRY
jgi:opacity protein-like surface antigen